MKCLKSLKLQLLKVFTPLDCLKVSPQNVVGAIFLKARLYVILVNFKMLNLIKIINVHNESSEAKIILEEVM